MTKAFYNETRAHREGVVLPRGHGRVWTGKTTEQRLDDAKARETALNDQLRASQRELEATRTTLLRDRHRFANGLCPCCNRSFTNVRRRMSDLHPDYDQSAVAVRFSSVFKCSAGASPHLRGAAHPPGPSTWGRLGPARRAAGPRT